MNGNKDTKAINGVKKTTADAASEYAAKDYYIAQRTDLLKNAFNAGASWIFNNQWHDIMQELPPRDGQYLVLYSSKNGDKVIPCYDLLVYSKDEDDDPQWGLAHGYEYLAFAITHWAFIPTPPKNLPLEYAFQFTEKHPFSPQVHNYVKDAQNKRLRYNLHSESRDKGKYGEGYFNNHIAKSLRDFFYNATEASLDDYTEFEYIEDQYGNSVERQLLRINDTAPGEEDDMLSFLIIGRTSDMLHLEYLGVEFG